MPFGFRSGICFPACETDADCPSPYSCVGDGACDYVNCGVDADCDEGQACQRDEQGGGFCRDFVEPACGDEEPDSDSTQPGAGAVDVDGPDLSGITICDDDPDWYSVEITDEPTLLDVSVSWDTGADLDFYVYDAQGRTVSQGASGDANPESATASMLPAGTYYILVNQFPSEGGDFLSTYSLSIDVDSSDPCTTEGNECGDLRPFRIVCGESGACDFLDGDGAVELGGACDSSNDCNEAADFCFTFGSAETGDNICTHRCQSEGDCGDVDGAACTPVGGGGRFAVCLPE